MQRCISLILILAGCFGYLDGEVINWDRETESSASSAISSGYSMYRGSTGNYRVICTVITENWTKYRLVYPGYKTNGGRLVTSPVDVQPGKKEKFVARKTGFFASGSYGTASWMIDNGERKRAVVMWDCPFSFDFKSNMLAVGFTDRAQSQHRNWHDQMSKGHPGNGLNFDREKYDHNTNVILYRDSRFEILGTMGSEHRATARVIVRPRRDEDLAPAVKDVIQG